uniref:Glucose dehydrogenase [acceptor] n=2 Tax=Lygus hesperus TaxID=30085 RepID=A0A0A9WUX8_LYGHE
MFALKYYWILYIYCTSAGIFSLFLFVHKQCEDARDWVFYGDFDSSIQKEYDFIVVGGGSAGALVAGRLAEDEKYTVLLIEAGGEPSPLHDIPITSPMLQLSPYDWQYVTLPQESACLGTTNRESRWPRGKVLGGTSRLNYMIYLRGHETDYDDWGWTRDDVMYYFKKSENQTGRFSSDSTHHGVRGGVYISDMAYRTDLSDVVLSAAEELNFPRVDLNDMKSSPGVMEPQVTAHDGARWSTDYAMRHISPDKKHLHVLTNSLVEKVLVRGGVEAYGVRFRRAGGTGEVRAKQAVVLSAGVVESPKLLMLSGIGPTRHLVHHGIDPILDLPVGDNLQDHVTTGLDLILLNQSLPLSEKGVLASPFLAYEYFLNHRGLLTHPGCEAIGLFHVKGDATPDIQLMVLPAGLSTDAGVVMRPDMHISDKVWSEYFAPLVGRQVMTMLPTLLHPKSKGCLRLRSANPEDPPLINPRYLAVQDDVKTLTLGIRLIEDFINTKAMKTMGAKLNAMPIPGCQNHTFDSDVYWECYLRHLTLTAYHPVGTCRMGTNPSESVVDHDLRVHNVSRLFVIDASIMPTMPSANINAAVLMIAEKGADSVRRLVHTAKHSCSLIEVFLQPTWTPAV